MCENQGVSKRKHKSPSHKPLKELNSSYLNILRLHNISNDNHAQFFRSMKSFNRKGLISPRIRTKKEDLHDLSFFACLYLALNGEILGKQSYTVEAKMLKRSAGDYESVLNSEFLASYKTSYKLCIRVYKSERRIVQLVNRPCLLKCKLKTVQLWYKDNRFHLIADQNEFFRRNFCTNCNTAFKTQALLNDHSCDHNEGKSLDIYKGGLYSAKITLRERLDKLGFCMTKEEFIKLFADYKCVVFGI